MARGGNKTWNKPPTDDVNVNNLLLNHNFQDLYKTKLHYELRVVEQRVLRPHEDKFVRLVIVFLKK